MMTCRQKATRGKLGLLLKFIGLFPIICFITIVEAAFTDNLTIGNAKALSLGHAVTADPPDIDSIHYNPAGLARLKGRQFFIKGIVGTFTTEYQFGNYGTYQQNQIDMAISDHSDENGNLTPEGEAFIYNEALNSKSSVEGPTVMLPGGMVDLPAAIGLLGGASYNPPGSDITFATNVYSPLMNGFHRESDDSGRFAQQRAAFTLITYFSPSIAFEFSESLSMGASINFSYSGMGIELPVRSPHVAINFLGGNFIQDNFCPNGSPSINGLDVCTKVPLYTQFGKLTFEVDNPVVLGFNLGILWSPTLWLSIGLSYNSPIEVIMNGDFEFPINDPFKAFLFNLANTNGWNNLSASLNHLGLPLPTADDIAKNSTGSMEVSYEIPQRVNAGISVQITPSLKINFDMRWSEWSKFSSIDLQFSEDVPLLMFGSLADEIGTGGSNGINSDSVQYQLGLRDVTYWGVGIEYQFSDRLALRTGFENRPSAVPSESPNAFIPINDGSLISLGLGIDFDDNSHIDFAMGYFNSKTHYPPCAAQLGNTCDPNNIVFGPYAGQDIQSEVTFLLIEVAYSKHF